MVTAGETLAGEILPRAVEGGRAGALVSVDATDWFAGLVEQHLRRVFAVLYRIVGNSADAQDLAQDVFLKAFQRRQQLRDPDRVVPWLLRIAANAAIDFQRSRAAERQDAWDDMLEPQSPEISAESRLLRHERHKRLHRALRLLSPKERAAIVLRDLEGLSGAEVAGALGCSRITVRAHIASARIKLRRILTGKSACG